jgi:hypothetical protein
MNSAQHIDIKLQKPGRMNLLLSVTLYAALTSGALAANTTCTKAPEGTLFSDTPQIECTTFPITICRPDFLGPLSLCVQGADPGDMYHPYDPPISLRPYRGLGSGFEGAGGVTAGGKCFPQSDGTLLCPTMTVSNAPTVAAPNNNNTLLNQPPASIAGGIIPSHGCGAAVSVNTNTQNNQTVTIGNITLTNSSPSAQGAANLVYNLLAGGRCAGSVFSLQNAINLILPPDANPINLSGGNLSIPIGAFITVPSGTINFNVNIAGSIKLPLGGSFADVTGATITVPQNATLTAASGGQITVQSDNGSTNTYIVVNMTPLPGRPITTINPIITINATAVIPPTNSTLPIDTSQPAVMPQS